MLVLHGDVRISLVAANSVAQPSRLAALDTVLVALQDESVRQGRAFDDGTDQGFELRGFRFLRTAPGADPTPLSAATWELVFAYEGDFWPIRPEPEGPAITAIPNGWCRCRSRARSPVGACRRRRRDDPAAGRPA